MLGRDHALLGALGYSATAPFVLANPSWGVLGTGAVVSAAFALLPDLDEPGSTVSRKLSLLSRGVSHLTRKLAGGHRQGTHSLMFVALVAGLITFAAQWPTAIAILVIASFLLVWRMLIPGGLRHLWIIKSLLMDVGFSIGVGAAYWADKTMRATRHHPAGSIGWLLLATAGGCFWHLVGDTITPEGVPYLWLPGVHRLQRIRVAVPIVGHTGSARESLLGSLMSLTLVVVTATTIWPGASSASAVALHHITNMGGLEAWARRELATLHIHLPQPHVVKPSVHLSSKTIAWLKSRHH